MKKIIVSLCSVGVSLLLSVAVHAQNDGAIAARHAEANGTTFFDAQKFANKEAIVGMGTPIDAATIGKKVQKTFAKKFGSSNSVNWSQLGKKDYLAQFELEGKKTHALFTNNGFMVYAVTYGTAADAPKDVRNILRSVYPQMEMGATFQVRYKGPSYTNSWTDQTAWVVNLEDENNIVVARVVDGIIDELGCLKKVSEQQKVRKGKVIIPRQ